MLSSFIRVFLLFSISILFCSCTSNDIENTVDKKPVSLIESKNGNIIVHFMDNTTQAFSTAQVEKLLKEKKIGETIYQLIAQNTKNASSRTQQRKVTNKEKYPYKVNGRDIYYVESNNGKFTIHLADKTSQTFSQHEIDCMMINHIITIDTYLLCIQKQQDEEISHKNDSSVFSFNYREINCPEFK